MVTQTGGAGIQDEQDFRHFFSTLSAADVISATGNDVNAYDVLVDDTIQQLTHDFSLLTLRGLDALSAHIDDASQQHTRLRIRISVDYFRRLIRHCEQSTDAAMRVSLITLFARSIVGTTRLCLTATQAECSEILRDIPINVDDERRRDERRVELCKAAAPHFIVDQSDDAANQSDDELVDSKDPDDYEFTADSDADDHDDSAIDGDTTALTIWTDVQLKIGEILRFARGDLLSAVAQQCKLHQTLVLILALADAHPQMFKDTSAGTEMSSTSPTRTLTSMHIHIAFVLGSIMSASPSLIPLFLPRAMCEAVCWWPIPYSTHSISQRINGNIDIRRETAIAIIGNLSAICLSKQTDSVPLVAIQYLWSFVADGIAAISEQLILTAAAVNNIINAPSTVTDSSSAVVLSQVYALCSIFTLYLSPPQTVRSNKTDETDIGVTLVALNVVANFAQIATFDSHERVHTHQPTTGKRCSKCQIAVTSQSAATNVQMPFACVHRLLLHAIRLSTSCSVALTQSMPFMNMIDCSCCYAPYTLEYILAPFFIAQHQHYVGTGNTHDNAVSSSNRRVVIRKTPSAASTSAEPTSTSIDRRLEESVSSLNALIEAAQLHSTSADSTLSTSTAISTIEAISQEIFSLIANNRRSNIIQLLNAEYNTETSAKRTPLHNSLIAFVHSLYELQRQCSSALTETNAALQQHKQERGETIDQNDSNDDVSIERRRYQSKLAAFERKQTQLTNITRLLKAVFDTNKRD